MNAPERLSPAQARRLEAVAQKLDASADASEAAAPRTGGRAERLTDESLDRTAAHQRARAASIRCRIRRAERTGRDTARLRISDHALVRYLERRSDCDAQAFADEIAPPGVAAVALRLGDGDFPVETPAGTHYITVKGGTVVTVVVHRT